MVGAKQTVSWSPPKLAGTSPIKSYKVICVSSTGGVTQSDTVAVGVTSVDFYQLGPSGALTAEETYTCTVAAVSDVGTGLPGKTSPFNTGQL